MTQPAAASAGRRGPSALAVLHAAVAAFVASAMVGVWAAPEPASAMAHLRVLAAGGLIHASVSFAGRFTALRRVAPAAAAVAGALASLYFLTQYRHLVSDAKVTVPHAIGLATSAVSRPLGWWSPQTNTVGTVLDGLLLVAGGLALAPGPMALRMAGASAAAVIGLGMLVSASRGSWLAAVVTLAVVGVVSWRRRMPAAAQVGTAVAIGIAGVVLSVVATAVAPGVPWWMRLATLVGRPDRLEVYQHALTLVRDATFTGIGAGDQFAAALSSYALLIQVPYLTYSHNLALDVWLEHGLLGLMTWWGLAAAVGVTAVAGERARLGWRFRSAWAGLLAIHVHGLSDARQSVDAWTWWPLFLLTGLMAAQVARHRVRVSWAAALLPTAAGVAIVAAVLAGRGPMTAAWHANLGALAQARGDRAGDRSDGTRAAAFAEARTQFDRALALNADDVSAQRRLGLLDLATGNYDGAAAHLRAAWRLDPASLTTQKAYGLAAVWTGELALAADLLHGVPGMVDELNVWSRWRESRGERALAIAAAQVSLRLDPAQPTATDWLRGLESGPPATPGVSGRD